MTAVLLIASWLALKPSRWRVGLLYAAVALAVYASIRWWVGPVDKGAAIPVALQTNLTAYHLNGAALYIGLLLPLIVAGLLVWRGVPAELKRVGWAVLLIYLPLWALMAVWQETRLLMPLAIVGLPLLTRSPVVNNGD